jgi:radical SAM protein with 4Fe4S-binding SPASM domain
MVFHHTLRLYSEAGGGLFVLSPILGEVSADPEWLELVATACSYPKILGVSCFTNAILLDRFGSEEILKSGLIHLNISTCLSSREEYHRLYGVDKYEQVVKNILDILECNQRLGNPVDIDLLLRMDRPYDPFYRSEVYQKIVKYLPPSKISVLDDDWDDFRGLIPQEGIPQGHSFKRNYVDKSTPCYAMFRKLEVLLDGTIQACACRVEPELWGGNIVDFDSLEEAWRSPELEKLRDDWFAGDLKECCKTCSHYIPYTSLLQYARPHTVAKKIAGKVRRTLSGEGSI